MKHFFLTILCLFGMKLPPLIQSEFKLPKSTSHAPSLVCGAMGVVCGTLASARPATLFYRHHQGGATESPETDLRPRILKSDQHPLSVGHSRAPFHRRKGVKVRN